MRYCSVNKLVVLVVFGLGMLQGVAKANDVYISQSGGGAGSSCSSPLVYTYFNASSNWTSGTPTGTQIGPGTTVHLCGTFTAASGNYLIFQGGGASGNPITLHFENGAILTAPNWGEGTGAIYSSGNNYITIDGGTNGIIQATSNGTGLATTVDDTGIIIYNCSGCVVENLTVSNMYVHTYTPTDEGGQTSGGIYISNGSNVAILNDVVHDAKWCIGYAFNVAGNSNLSISGNTTYHCDHGVAVESGGANAALAGATVYGNTIYDGYLWDDNGNNNHHDGIHTWAVQSGVSISSLSIYNNYVYGNWGFGLNSFIFMEASSGGSENGALAYNNLLVDGTTLRHTGCGYICNEDNSTGIYNNTIIGQNTSQGIGINMYGTSVSVENNTVSTLLEAVGVPNFSQGGTITVWDYNNYYNVGSNGWNGGSVFSAWQAPVGSGGCGCDAHSSLGNPNLGVNYAPTPNSLLLIKQGANLAGLGITDLDLDRVGNPRPGTGEGNWDVAAYQTPTPPTALAATPH